MPVTHWQENIHRSALIAVLLVVAATVTACGGGKRDIRLSITGTKTINPDENGASHPVVLRVYQLSGKDRFGKASFRSIEKNDLEALGNELLEKKEVTLEPDSKLALDLEVDSAKGAEYLGVMGSFMNSEGDRWRMLIPARVRSYIPFKTPTIHILVDKNMVMPAEK